MNVLVTGGTGFIGSAVVRALVARGDAVRALVRKNSDRRHLDGLDVDIMIGDLDDPASLKVAVAGRKALYHVAADYRLWIPKPDQIYRTNVEGSRHLMRVAADAGVERIVYTSSVATLGLTGNRTPADETTPTTLAQMVGHYKRSKFLAEQTVQAMIDDEGLPAVIVNPSAPVGPRDAKPTPTGRLVVDAAKGRMPAYIDTGLNVVHVEDVARGHLLAFEHGKIGERYILGGDDMALSDILRTIAQLTGVREPRLKLPIGLIMPIAYITEAIWRIMRQSREPFVTIDGLKMAKKLMFFSSAKAKAELGYRSQPAIVAFRDALDWYREHGYLDK